MYKIPIINIGNLIDTLKSDRFIWTIQTNQHIGGDLTESSLVETIEDITDVEKFKLAMAKTIYDLYNANDTYGETYSFQEYCVKILYANFLGYYDLDDRDESVEENKFMEEIGSDLMSHIYTLIDYSLKHWQKQGKLTSNQLPQNIWLSCEKRHKGGGDDHDIDILLARRRLKTF